MRNSLLLSVYRYVWKESLFFANVPLTIWRLLCAGADSRKKLVELYMPKEDAPASLLKVSEASAKNNAKE